MQNKEKAIEILMNELDYCYCDNCKHSVDDDRYCVECYRKYQNWALSRETAERIVDKLNQIGMINPASKEEIKGALKNAE